RAPHVGAAGRAARQPAGIRGNAGLRAGQGARAGRAHADHGCLLPDPLGGRRIIKKKTPFLVLSTAHAAPPALDFSDDFEAHVADQLPGAPWKEETYKSGAVIAVDNQHAFSGQQAMHVLTPAGAEYRRGYVAIHLHGPLPQLQSGFFGRAMVWLDAAPGTENVHWTLLQGEGRSADDRYNSIYRLGLEQRGGTQLMANFETTPPL